MLEPSAPVTWEYDSDADVLYLTLAEPRPALGVDIGDGLVVRYDETHQAVVGLTVIGLRERLLRQLTTVA